MNTLLRYRYDKIAPNWNGEAYAGLRRDDLLPAIIRYANVENLHWNSRILDAMCGTGIVGTTVSEHIRQNQESAAGCSMFFLDFSQKMLDLVNCGGEKVCGNICQIPKPGDYFDRTFLRFGLHDLEKPEQMLALKEIHRTLKPECMLILVTYAPDLDTQEHYNMLVNYKDQLAGQKGGDRYFGTPDEYMQMMQNAGFSRIERRFAFYGTLRYMQTGELGSGASDAWKKFALSLPYEIRNKMQLKEMKDGTIEYDFPAVVFIVTK